MELRSTLAALALSLAGTPTASAAIETFLYIPGVPGESVDADFRDWIDVTALSVAVANRVCSGFTITKPLDATSPILSASALSAVVYPTMTVQTRKQGEGLRPFLTYTLTNVVVNAVGVTYSPAGTLVERVVLYPAVIATNYRPVDDKGGFGTPIQSTLTCKYK
jgi:type VI protein secretion system component Hcp